MVGNQASSRLYPAEGVAAAIEVKSNVAGQWSEVVSTATKLAPLERHFDSSMGSTPERRIPLFAIGYSGWKETKAIRERLGDAPIDGILVIDAGVFVQAKMSVTGSWSLWGLVGMSARIGKQVEIDVGRPIEKPWLTAYASDRRQLFELTHTDAASFLPDSPECGSLL